jgi:hypothetical protein
MPALITNKAIETVVRAKLEHDGYEVSEERGHGETGPDIVVTRGAEHLHIEAIA